MTNEVLVSYSRLTLDNRYEDPSLLEQGAGGINFQGIFPASNSPYLPTDLLHGWGSSGQVGNLWAKANDMYAHNDTLQFGDKLTKLLGSHGMKFGFSVDRGQKQQNFQNLESGQLWFGTDNNEGTGNSAADMLVGRIGSFTQGTARTGNPAVGQPFGKFRYWNVDAFAQDSWKLRSNLTLEYGVRFGYWTNNQELGGLGGYFDRLDLYDPTKSTFIDPGTFQRLNGVCYVETGCAPDGVLDNRDPFALPRVNVAWDIDGQGNNVLRGGYGKFYNRNMGNVEYDNTLRLAPNAYQVGTDFWAGGNYGNGLGLTYDTVHEATLASRIGSLAINTLSPDSFKFPTTHSFSTSFARRIPWNQVVEVAYVGTRGRDLVSRRNGNVMPFGALNTGHLQRYRPVEPGQPLRGRHRIDQPGHVPPVQRLQWHQHRLRRLGPALHLRLRRRVESRLDASHAQPTDRPGVPVLRRLHTRPHRGHARRRVLADRPVRCQPDLRRPQRGSHPHPQRVVERVPAGWREGRSGQRRSAAAC